MSKMIFLYTGLTPPFRIILKKTAQSVEREIPNNEYELDIKLSIRAIKTFRQNKSLCGVSVDQRIDTSNNEQETNMENIHEH